MKNILLAPVLTEKATQLAQKKVYTFLVAKSANKAKVKKTIEDLYKVKVNSVNINIKPGKTRRVGKKMNVKQLSDTKVAYIKVKEGKIPLFPEA